MRKGLLIFIFQSAVACFAQQDGIYSNEGFNTFQNNPASYANSEVWSVNTFGRLQWVGIQDAPRSIHLNGGVELPIGLLMGLKRNIRITLGSSYMYEEIGFSKNHQWNFSFGVPIRLGKQSELTISLAPGIYSIKFEPSTIPPQTAQDSLLLSGGKGTSFDLSTGLMYSWKTLYVGFSVTHLTTPRISNINFQLARQYHLQAGYKIPLGKHFVFPMMQAQADGAGMVFQAMTYFVYKKNLFSLGAGYRLGNTILLGAAFELKGFRLAYNYDLVNNPLAPNTSGSHEVRLSFIQRLQGSD
jgi:type IX secretion system PorP/SprF family membrane protein